MRIDAASGPGGMSRGRSRGAYKTRLVVIEQTIRECSHPPSIKPNLSQILPSSCLLRSAEKHRLLRPASSSSRAHFEASQVDVRIVEAPFHVSSRETVRARQISTSTTTHNLTFDDGLSSVTTSTNPMPRAFRGSPVTPNGAPAAHVARCHIRFGRGQIDRILANCHALCDLLV